MSGSGCRRVVRQRPEVLYRRVGWIDERDVRTAHLIDRRRLLHAMVHQNLYRCRIVCDDRSATAFHRSNGFQPSMAVGWGRIVAAIDEWLGSGVHEMCTVGASAVQ